MKSFLFEFFRSRFRRKSLKKFGDVNEEPLHILPSNGGRTDGVISQISKLSNKSLLYSIIIVIFDGSQSSFGCNTNYNGGGIILATSFLVKTKKL